MFIKRIELLGFKTFADKAEIEVSQGITAVVGPNGSGKSNIADALMWVLGESNVRNLRGQRATDVIFNGSEKRRAIGLAEVSLTLDNSCGTLPLDFSEVTVTRRAYRSGEGEYFINKTRCRLKDIYELRDQTGLATYTYLYNEFTGKLVFFCNSIGYGIPYATQYSASESVQSYNVPRTSGGERHYGVERLPQAEPNGLFSPASAEGTWVQCKDPSGKDVRPVYVEPRVIVSQFRLIPDETSSSVPAK